MSYDNFDWGSENSDFETPVNDAINLAIWRHPTDILNLDIQKLANFEKTCQLISWEQLKWDIVQAEGGFSLHLFIDPYRFSFSLSFS